MIVRDAIVLYLGRASCFFVSPPGFDPVAFSFRENLYLHLSSLFFSF